MGGMLDIKERTRGRHLRGCCFSLPERASLKWRQKQNQRRTINRNAAERTNYILPLSRTTRLLREGLASLIRRKPDMKVVGEASNGREAVELWNKLRPDVTLLDLNA